jgi:uncharacterized radical SAM protein YgiQ
MEHAAQLFSRRKHWAHRFGTAPVLPMSREEMETLGWDACDVILVSGDAYVDHPSFGIGLIGRLLEAQGFRVGIISQPPWEDAEAFARLGAPTLFFGVTGGNMDSMVNRYTSERRVRSNDAYTAGGEGGRRPDRSTIVYAQRCREAFPDVPIVLGGIEASLRRIAHYDYWSDRVRRSILLDAKADLLLYGNAERAVVEVAHRLARGESIHEVRDVRGSAFVQRGAPADAEVIDGTRVEGSLVRLRRRGDAPRQASPTTALDRCFVRVPSFEKVRDDKTLYAHTSRVVHRESNPGNARGVVQRHGNRDLWITPPPIPLSTREMDRVFELPYSRQPHPSYAGHGIPAYEMIRFSVTIMRGCFGGCTFCSITEHEGRRIQSRSTPSVLREIEAIRDTVPGFTGVVSDLGGPTANMYRQACKDPKIEDACRRLSCVHPGICENLDTSHAPLIDLYQRARELPGVKKILIASGLRYDLAIRSPEYVEELVTHHVGGYLKIAPEHVAAGPLSKMMKPGIESFERFSELFAHYSAKADKKQYLIPYFIAAHPGTTDEDMLELSMWLKREGFRPDQVQAFLPSPMSLATAMYHTGRNPLRRLVDGGEAVEVPKGTNRRRLHKAFLRYHDANNWPMLRDALKGMGREELIGASKRELIPWHQPIGTGGEHEGRRRKNGSPQGSGRRRRRRG